MHLVGNTWTTVSGYADRISTAPDGAPYVVSSSGGVYSYRNGSWTPVNNSQQLATSAAAGADSGIYFLSRTAGSVAGNFTVWRKPWGATGLIQLPGAGAQIAASFDTSTYTVPGVGTLAPYGYFVLQSSGAVTYYSPQGTQAVQFPVTASAIAPVLGGFYALSYPQTAAGASVYYFDYASGTTTTEPGTYVALSAYGSVGTSPHLFALDAQNHAWSAPISPSVEPIEITEYPYLPSSVQASFTGIAPGPGGIWFAVNVAKESSKAVNEVAVMSAPGQITYYPLSDTLYTLEGGGLAEGSDGAMWLTYIGGILRITGSGSMTHYTIAGSNGPFPFAIASGPGGALWFTDYYGPGIGSITTTGAVTQYPLPQPSQPVINRAIAVGSDGALWFPLYSGNSDQAYIGRLATDGTSSIFPLTQPQFGSTNPAVQDITSGSDGALWFTALATPGIGRITTSGVLTVSQFTKVEPLYLTSGPDGALWFTNVNQISSTGGLIGRMTTSGTTTYYPVPAYVDEPSDGRYSNSVAAQIATGSDGAIYFMEPNKIGRIVLNK
jgi:virginiamycin B lyase